MKLLPTDVKALEEYAEEQGITDILTTLQEYKIYEDYIRHNFQHIDDEAWSFIWSADDEEMEV